MDWRWQNGSWIGRGALPGDFYDLAVTGGNGWEEEPPADAVARLERAQASMATLFAGAVRATCEARQAVLGWKAGPPGEQWSLTEMRVTATGALWLSIHEYETDEYSLWMVRFDDDDRPMSVRRRPWVPIDGEPSEAGTQLSGTP